MLPRKPSSGPLQAITARILGGEKLVQEVDRLSLNKSKVNVLSQTDVWLREALVKRPINRRDQVALQNIRQPDALPELSLAVILSYLRKLRLKSKFDEYFVLLNRLQSSQIRWVSRSGSQMSGEKPVELYRELSHMLRLKSIATRDQADNFILAKFAINLLENYAIVLESREKISPDIFFWRNCADVCAQTSSIRYLLRFNELVKDEHLIVYANSAFYLRTSQHPNLFTSIKSIEHLKSPLVPDLFGPIIRETLLTFASVGLEKEAIHISKMFFGDSYNQTANTLSNVYFSTERNGAFGLQRVLDERDHQHHQNTSLHRKTFQDDHLYEDYIRLISDIGLNLFEEEHPLDFLLTKLPNEHLSVEQWCQFFERTRPPKTAPASLLAFHLNLILTHVAAHRSAGFIILLWHCLITDHGLEKAFMDTHRLKLSQHRSGFHILIRAIGTSSSTKLSGYELFRFLKQSALLKSANSCFIFTETDYRNLMRSCTQKSNPIIMNYYLYNYFVDFGGKCIKVGPEALTWNLSASFKSLLETMHLSGYDDGAFLNNIRAIGDWYVNNFPLETKGCQISQDKVQDIFNRCGVTGSGLEKFLEQEQPNDPLDGEYSLIADLDTVERMGITLRHLQAASNEM
ncbi:LADA_0F08042g1_1 [Lachancea dasiensis]|uniref:LADA_0F08042g1_1 n=1 Tax=Lachancea dasiensis TaxID=1072105 RepID=A0A1G4JKI7_9SACH|nr:LADA_0F08042g1_1 [Lachancea dasiensis]